jgi:hypothetical protein
MINGVILGPSMRRLRHWLSPLLAVMLVFQLGEMIAPLVLSPADAADMCTCPGGTRAATCPMHHGKDDGSSGRSSGAKNRCAMRSGSLPSDLALLTMGAGAGVLPALSSFDVAEVFSASLPVLVSSPIVRADFPDSPPPRR